MKTYGSYTTHTNIMFRFGLLYMIIADHVSKGNFMWFPSRKWEVYSMQFHNKTMSLQQKKNKFWSFVSIYKSKIIPSIKQYKESFTNKTKQTDAFGCSFGRCKFESSWNVFPLCIPYNKALKIDKQYFWISYTLANGSISLVTNKQEFTVISFLSCLYFYSVYSSWDFSPCFWQICVSLRLVKYLPHQWEVCESVCK